MILFIFNNDLQGRNHRENLDATPAMVGRICPPPPPGGDRVKVSENLGVTSVAQVAPVVTSLTFFIYSTLVLGWLFGEKNTNFV